jgi:glycosyltransferase involved in cell wall biosynthesis
VNLEENKGLSAVRNIGVKCTGFEYVTFLDADDCLHPDFLNVARLYYEFGKDDAYACDYTIITDQDEHMETFNCIDYPLACGIVYQTKHIRRLGGYDEQLRTGEDTDFRKRFVSGGYKTGRIEIPLYRYRLHDNNMTKEMSGTVIGDITKEMSENGKRSNRSISSSTASQLCSRKFNLS